MDFINRLIELEKLVEMDNTERSLTRTPIRKEFLDQLNPLESLDNVSFYDRFHMKKLTALFVFNLIKDEFEVKCNRAFHFPPIIKFLIGVRFFTTGSFQIVVGDVYEASQPTVCRIVKQVSIALAKHCKTFIRYPSFEQANLQKRKFYSIGNFPGVVGCIDGTHIPIQSPGGPDAELFRNRKQTFSINVQAICDADMKFTDLVVRWYGSAHDSRIFENSWIKDKLENSQVPGILLGDSGYACTPYLMTPLLNPQSPAEIRFDLDVTTFQMAVLFAWNQRPKDKISYENLRLATELPDPELRKTLWSLVAFPKVKRQLLTYTPEVQSPKDFTQNSTFWVNQEFTVVKNGRPQKRGKISLIGRLQLSTERSREEDNEGIVQLRILRVQEAIIKILKMRKRISNAQLQVELVDILKNMFLPSKKMIKEQIEWLIENKYMKRDETDINSFIYMA